MARKTGEVFDVAAGTYEVLLRRALHARLDSSLPPSDEDLWLSPGYELYGESVYSATACAEVCSVLRVADGLEKIVASARRQGAAVAFNNS